MYDTYLTGNGLSEQYGLSRSTQIRILDWCVAKRWYALFGLDSYQAFGLQASSFFAKLRIIVKNPLFTIF